MAKKSFVPSLEALEDRVVPFATTGLLWLNTNLSASIVPDGTAMAGGNTSSLFASYDAKFPTDTWQYQYARALQTWASVTPLNFHLVADNGAPMGTPGPVQGNPNFGDIRWGGYASSSSYLGLTYPPYLFTTLSGDININTQVVNNIGSKYDIYSLLLHEMGHSLGLDESTVTNSVMNPSSAAVFTGLLADDIAGIQAIYGPRPQETTPNNTLATATALTLDSLGRANRTADLGSITDVDYYAVTAPADGDGTLNVTMDTSNLSLLIPKLSVYNAAGQLLATANGGSDFGSTVTVKVSGLTPGQNYYVRAEGNTDDVFGMGGYRLNVQFGLAEPGVVNHFQISAPTSTTAGNAVPITVTAMDAFGNVVPGYTGTIHFSSSDPQAELPEDYTFQSADNGQHTFDASLDTSGSQSLSVADTIAGWSGSPPTINVDPAAADSLSVIVPTSSTPGSAVPVTVAALDEFGNVATGYSGTIEFSSSDTQAGLPAAYTFQPGDSGQHIFSVTFNTTGAQSVTATDADAELASDSASLSLSWPASNFSISVPANTTAGSAVNVSVTALDAFGNVATNYTGTIEFSSSDVQAGLPESYTFQPGDNGQCTFSVVLKTAGSQSVTAVDTLDGSINGSASIDVSSAAISRIQITAPSSTTAGALIAVTVAVVDAYGNIAADYRGTVKVSSTDTSFVAFRYTFTAADQGQHLFTLALKKAGSQSLKVNDTRTNTLILPPGTVVPTATQAAIKVNPAAPARYVLTGVPSSVLIGRAYYVTVTIRDAFGNVVPNYRTTVHFRSTLRMTLPANYTFSGGSHRFRIVFRTRGINKLTVVEVNHTALNGVLSGIRVN